MAEIKWRIVESSPGRGYLHLECERGFDLGGAVPECGRGLWLFPHGGVMWQWDGDKEAPTITPSIDCKGGCGRHFTMTKGVIQP